MSALAAAAVTIDRHLDGDDALARMVADVRDGLTREGLKELRPKYFYDARGSALFDRITELPEYYPTRCERAILNRHAPEIVAATGAVELVELGSGTASKTRALLYAMAGAGSLERYLPFDVDESVVERCADELTTLYPGLEVHGVVGDFERHLGEVPAGERRLVALLGGTIGNLHPEERARMLDEVSRLLGQGDHLLLGTDLVKDRRVLEAAYDDAQGVTAEFNRNVIRALDAALDGDLDPDGFDHVAFYDEREQRIEMRLRARGPQRGRFARAGLEVAFADGEEVRTEISSKFTRERVESELGTAGLRLERFLTDPAGWFGVSLAALR